MLFAALASLVTLPLAGRWIASRGSRAIAAVSSCAAVASLVLPYVAPDYRTLLVATFLLGVAYSAMDVAMNAQAVLVEAVATRPIMSSFHGIFSVGGLAGAVVTALALAAGGTALADTVVIAVVAEGTLFFAVRRLARRLEPPAPAR
ncbi:MAG: hypothetical protein NVS2B3_19850 [Vulcanimicrobiaceae bacterium]